MLYRRRDSLKRRRWTHDRTCRSRAERGMESIKKRKGTGGLSRRSPRDRGPGWCAFRISLRVISNRLRRRRRRQSQEAKGTVRDRRSHETTIVLHRHAGGFGSARWGSLGPPSFPWSRNRKRLVPLFSCGLASSFSKAGSRPPRNTARVAQDSC